MPSKGIVYIAVDNSQYLEMAIASINSLRNTGCNTKIVIYTNLECDNRLLLLDVQVLGVNVGSYEFNSRAVKTQLGCLALFDRNLFIDCDIIAVDNIDSIWDYKSTAMAMAYYPSVGQSQHTSSQEKEYTLGIVGDSCPHYNSGVILFDKLKDLTLFDVWHQEWGVYKSQDQLALARAIFKTNIDICQLPSRYNQTPDKVNAETVLIHYSGDFKQKFPMLNVNI